MKANRIINFIFSFGWSFPTMRFFVPLLLVGIITNGYPISPSNSSNALRHGIRLQPELDKIDIEAYLKNTKALKIQVQCLIFDGPCDWVGRWLKPRAAAALLGECLLCTEHQKIQLPKIMSFIQVNFPEEFKLGIKKYLFQFGIAIPSDEPATTTTTTTEAPTEIATANGLETTQSPV